jgi:hypothetical protein
LDEDENEGLTVDDIVDDDGDDEGEYRNGSSSDWPPAAPSPPRRPSQRASIMIAATHEQDPECVPLPVAMRAKKLGQMWRGTFATSPRRPTRLRELGQLHRTHVPRSGARSAEGVIAVKFMMGVIRHATMLKIASNDDAVSGGGGASC